MSRPDIIELIVPGADPVAIAAGIEAAWAEFDAVDAWPWDAAAVMWELEGADMPGVEPTRERTEREWAVGFTWDAAQEAAFAAAWPGYPERPRPEGSSFGLQGERTFVQFRTYLPNTAFQLEDGPDSEAAADKA